MNSSISVSNKKMRIVHVTSYFSDKVSYQENMITVGQKELGHEVHLITSPLEFEFPFNKGNRTHDIGISDYKGVLIHRIPIIKEIKNRFVFYKNLYSELVKIAPDVIFFYDHSPAIFTCVRYKKNHDCKLDILVHSSIENSMNSFIGKPYHKIIWRFLIKIIQKYYDNVFAGLPECVDFAKEIYHIEESKIHHVPLPGDASLLDNYDSCRKENRRKLGLSDEDIALFHTGKLPQAKKTAELLQAYHNNRNSRMKLFVVGSIDDSFKTQFEDYLKKDNRIVYLGWKNPDEMRQLFTAADWLVQPGGASNTYLDAICCGVPLALLNSAQARDLTKYDNGYLFDSNDVKTIEAGLETLMDKKVLDIKKKNTLKAAKEYHYVEIARKLLE